MYMYKYNPSDYSGDGTKEEQKKRGDLNLCSYLVFMYVHT